MHHMSERIVGFSGVEDVPYQTQVYRNVAPIGVYEDMSPTSKMVYGVLSTAGMVLGAFHGYKRNESVGWAIGWALLGGAFPFITIPVSLAQGFGERKRG